MRHYLSFFAFLLLISCSGLEKTEYSRLRKQNCTAEYIARHKDEYFSPLVLPVAREREPYIWEDVEGLDVPKITKEFFRCKGKATNPPRFSEKDSQLISDCTSKHSLPVIKDREDVYPILIQLLNYLQKKTKKRVIITCGHRCPTHNIYADSSKASRTSKHMIGAEVDFFVQGMEDKPLEIVELLMQFYKDNPNYQGLTDYQTFLRYEKDDTNVSTKPWFNKEIFIKVFQENEGRGFDNQHPFPYLSLQVRYDKEKSERVTYTWEKAKNFR